MKPQRSVLVGIVLGAVIVLGAQACGGGGGANTGGAFSDGDGFGGSGAFNGDGGAGGSTAAGGAGGGGGQVMVPVPKDGGTDDAATVNVTYETLCGEGCLPDDALACLAFDGGSAMDGAPQMRLIEPQALDAAPAVPGPGFGPEQPAPAQEDDAAPGPPTACHVRRVVGVATAVCEEAGQGPVGAPCMTSSDCRAGFGCVGEPNAGQCRRFCCGGDASCGDPGTYCASRPLRDDAAEDLAPLQVPVCVKADGCSLGDVYPCPVGESCSCAEGRACTIVRDDGTTSCVVPGDGVAGDPCPCAAGHVCSRASSRCLKICRLAASTGECGSGRCQATTGFPEGFGVCVGSDPDAG